MSAHPRLKPSFRPIPRGSGTVQLGLTAEAGGIVLSGLSAPEVALLERLDGSLTTSGWYALSRAWGVERRRADEMLRLLRDRCLLASGSAGDVAPGPADTDGLVAPAPLGPVRSPPGEGHVVVSGSGPVPAAIGALLRSGDVRHVDVGPWAADLVEAQLRAYPASGVPPDLVLPVTSGDVDARAGEPWRRRGVLVLPVVADAARVVVGPLVGADPSGPCLECLQLTRADRDNPWSGPAVPVVGAGLDDAMVSVAAGVAALVARSVLAGDAVPRGVSVEVWSPWPRLEHRRWQQHPACAGHPVDGAGPTGGEDRPGPVGSGHRLG